MCFNPRTHEGCDQLGLSSSLPSGCFNPRTHEGCDVCVGTLHAQSHGFNPRTHEGCDSSYLNRSRRSTSFNPRTHEGCDFLLVFVSSFLLSFNPRTHEGCDSRQILSCVRLAVSIHAPTRGATADTEHTYHKEPVSIHAPTRGATFIVHLISLRLGFNPRTHEGCDRASLSFSERDLSFNPRTHEGCDTPGFRAFRMSARAFQSTHPRGVRPCQTIFCRQLDVSIHAPTRGATVRLTHHHTGHEVSIHAPTRGATAEWD